MSAALIKRILHGRLEDEADGLNALTLVLSMEDAVEGMEAFFGDRDPVWQNK